MLSYPKYVPLPSPFSKLFEGGLADKSVTPFDSCPYQIDVASSFLFIFFVFLDFRSLSFLFGRPHPLSRLSSPFTPFFTCFSTLTFHRCALALPPLGVQAPFPFFLPPVNILVNPPLWRPLHCVKPLHFFSLLFLVLVRFSSVFFFL